MEQHVQGFENGELEFLFVSVGTINLRLITQCMMSAE